MLPPGTDFIIAYMDSLPVLAGSETGDSWSQCDSLEQDFTHQGIGGGGGGGRMHSGLNGLNFEKFFTDLEGWPLLVSLVHQRPVITKSNIVSKFPWYEIIIAIISTSIIIVNSMRPTMYLLTEWEGRTGKYLARGHGVRTEHSKVRAP